MICMPDFLKSIVKNAKALGKMELGIFFFALDYTIYLYLKTPPPPYGFKACVHYVFIPFYHHFDFKMTSFLHLFDAFAAPGDFKLEAHELEP